MNATDNQELADKAIEVLRAKHAGEWTVDGYALWCDDELVTHIPNEYEPDPNLAREALTAAADVLNGNIKQWQCINCKERATAVNQPGGHCCTYKLVEDNDE